MALKLAFNPITAQFDLVQNVSGFVKLDQTPPQTMTGLNDGAIVLNGGVIGTRTIYELATITYFGGL